MLTYAPAIASSLFRLLAYIFLQIIPSRLIRFAIPASYATYLLTSWLFPVPPPRAISKKLKEKIRPGVVEYPVRRPSPLATLCFTLPTQSRALTYANLLINTLLFAAVIDFAASPFFDTAADLVFTRVGAVYPDSVKIVARYPHPNAIDATLLLLYRESTNDTAPWKDGPSLHLTADADWVATARLTNLWPSTAYEYVLATQNKTIFPEPATPIAFRTFPDPRLQSARRFRFIASSCTVPNFPYRGPFHRRHIEGFDLLADYLTPERPLNDTANSTVEAVPTEFMLFLGDFIYADVPFYVGDDQEAYRRLYRRNYQSPSYKRVYEQLPVFHAYDDHEFVDNYAGKSQDIPPFANGSNAYNIYAGNANYDPVQPGTNYYEFQHGDVAFFVMDTRRYRSGPAAEATMLGDTQLAALTDWLHKVNETASFKFVVSSVPFTELFTHDAKLDAWAAYSAEKARVLSALQGVPGVVVISGDRHQFAAVEFARPPGGQRVLEVSTSPLSMFYVPLISAMERRTEEMVSTAQGAEVPRESVLEYIPKGNFKWSAFEIDTRNATRPTLRIETVIDGKPAYHLEVAGMPVKAPHAAGLGALVGTNVRDLFERIGLSPRKWF